LRSGDFADLPAGCDIPQPHFAVVAAARTQRGEGRAVGAECKFGHTVGAQRPVALLTRGDVPEPNLYLVFLALNRSEGAIWAHGTHRADEVALANSSASDSDTDRPVRAISAKNISKAALA
jgi:hypothetical protein